MSQLRKDYNANPEEISFASNGGDAELVFGERKKYVEDIFPDGYISNMADTWGKDRFYGKIDTHGNAIFPRTRYMKPLRYTKDTQTYYALGFVADAWRDFAERLRDLTSSGILYKDSPWAAPEIHSACPMVSSLYNSYMTDTIYPVFVGQYLLSPTISNRITGPNDFLKVFTDFLKGGILDVGALTLSGYIEGMSTSPVISGLVLEIGDESYDDDFEKISNYADLNFNLVSKIASEYGFMIDRNIPFRLVADLSSAAMQEYMKGVPIVGVEGNNKNPLDQCKRAIQKNPDALPDAYGFSQIPGIENVIRHINIYIDPTDEVVKPGYLELQEIRETDVTKEKIQIVFSSFFRQSWEKDILVLRSYLFNMYNTFAQQNPFFTTRSVFGIKECNRVVVHRREMIGPNDGDPLDQFGDKWALKTFYIARSLERKLGYTTEQDKANLREIFNIYDFSLPDEANKYYQTLRIIYEKYIGPLQNEVLNLRQIKDIIKPHPRNEL